MNNERAKQAVSDCCKSLKRTREVFLGMALGEASSINSNNDEYFKSVASATALGANKIRYIYVPSHTTDLRIFTSKLKAIKNYFKHRQHFCEITLTLFLGKKARQQGGGIREWNKVLKTAKEKGRLKEFEIITYEDVQTLPTLATEVLKDCGVMYYDGTNAVLRSSLVNGAIAQKIAEELPYFEFDSYNRRFVNCVGCEELRTYRVNDYIQVEDMFALMNAKDKVNLGEDYSDTYMDYWNIYCGDAIGEKNFALCARSWTKMSNILKSGGGNCLRVNRKSMGSRDKNEIRVMSKMMYALKEKGFLTELRIDEKNFVTATMASRKVKGMFAKAGDVLEQYVYHEALKTGWFDDVQTGYKFRWEYEEVANELDCMLTKGFRSVFVECKSTKDADENFYLTLDSLADHFGIGYKKVLIMVTDVRNDSYDIHISRGKQMDIITISEKAELMRIGERLKEIMMK